MSKCTKCRQKITGETGILCAGVCGKVYHTSKKCCGIEEKDIEIYGKYQFLKYICTDCETYITNVDYMLKEIQTSIEKNCSYLKEYKNEFKATLKQNENEITNLLTAIENRYDERFNALRHIQQSCQESEAEVNKICNVAMTLNKKSEELITGNQKIMSEIKKLTDRDEATFPAQKTTYANIVKSQKVKEIKTARPAIIIATKRTENKSVKHTDVINAFRKSVTFTDTNYAPAKILPLSNSKIRVEFDSIEQRDTTMKKLSNITSLSAENAKNKRPLVILKGISKDVGVKEIIQIIRNQNPSINEEMQHDGDILFRFARKNTKNPDIFYNIVLEVTGRVRNAMMILERINIDFQRVNVSDFSPFVQCFKCLQFGHTQNRCNAAITPCSHCGNIEHKYESCPHKGNNEKLKCFNCAHKNEKSKNKVDVKHSATNAQQCPQIKSMQQRINSRVDMNL